MRTHEYTLGKGYPEALKGTKVTWPLPSTVREAIDGGFFKDEAVLVHRACANLNVDKGHAIQEAVLEAEKGDPEKGVAGRLLTVAEMAKIAAETNATGEIRQRGTGGQKAQAKAFAQVTQKASERWATASEEQRAFLVELGLFTADGKPVGATAEENPAGKAAVAVAKAGKGGKK